MAGRKRKTEREHTFQPVLDFVDLVDQTFLQLTGKPLAAWLREATERARELPPGRETATSQDEMSLANAYMILGLPKTATLEEVKRNYRNLANVFHPDKPGGYAEAMRLLNNAYQRIMKEKGQ